MQVQVCLYNFLPSAARTRDIHEGLDGGGGGGGGGGLVFTIH